MLLPIMNIISRFMGIAFHGPRAVLHPCCTHAWEGIARTETETEIFREAFCTVLIPSWSPAWTAWDGLHMFRDHWISAWCCWNCQWMCMLTTAVHERLKWWIDIIPILHNTLMFWRCLLPPISPPWLVRKGPPPLLPTTGQSTRTTDLQHPRPRANLLASNTEVPCLPHHQQTPRPPSLLLWVFACNHLEPGYKSSC